MHFCILPNFILRMSWVVKNVSFELNFWHESKFLDFAKFHPSKVMQERSNSRFQAKFSMRLKISSFAVLEVVVKKSHFWVKFSTQINIFMDFVKFHPLLVLSGQNSHNLSQIFNVTKNFWILPNFILCMSWVVKNLNFGQNFQHDSKFLDFAKFHPLQVRPCHLVKNLLSQIFNSALNFLILPNFILSQVQSGQNSQFWAKFSTPLKSSRFCQISSFVGPEWPKMSVCS